MSDPKLSIQNYAIDDGALCMTDMLVYASDDGSYVRRRVTDCLSDSSACIALENMRKRRKFADDEWVVSIIENKESYQGFLRWSVMVLHSRLQMERRSGSIMSQLMTLI